MMSSFQEAIKSPVGRKKKSKKSTSGSSADAGFVSSIPNARSPKLKTTTAAAGSLVAAMKKTSIVVKKELGIVSTIGSSAIIPNDVEPHVKREDDYDAIVVEKLENDVDIPVLHHGEHHRDAKSKSINFCIGKQFDLFLGSEWRHYLNPSESTPALLMLLILSVAWTALLWVAFADLK